MWKLSCSRRNSLWLWLPLLPVKRVIKVAYLRPSKYTTSILLKNTLLFKNFFSIIFFKRLKLFMLSNVATQQVSFSSAVHAPVYCSSMYEYTLWTRQLKRYTISIMYKSSQFNVRHPRWQLIAPTQQSEL